MAANLRKRRGYLRASVTRLAGRVTELEGTRDQPHNADHARQLLSKLQTLDADYRALHLEIIDLIDEKEVEALEAEQRHIDQLDDDVSDLTVKLQTLIAPSTAAPDAPAIDRRSLNRRLGRVRAVVLETLLPTLTSLSILPFYLSTLMSCPTTRRTWLPSTRTSLVRTLTMRTTCSPRILLLNDSYQARCTSVRWQHHSLETVLGSICCRSARQDDSVQCRENCLPPTCHQRRFS